MSNSTYKIPDLPLKIDLETKEVLRQLAKANRALAELKGIAHTIPNEQILISSLTLQEAKESSAVENIVTTQDDLYRAGLDLKDQLLNASTKEVLNYREAIQLGFRLVRKDHLLTNNIIKQIQQALEYNRAGFRTVPGTVLKDSQGNIVYMPPQDAQDVNRLMDNLEQYINNPELSDVDPLIKMAIIHHQIESIHPFYDGNGRTGRIVLILYLVISDLLDLPILYLSRYITQNKSQYYYLIQAIRDTQGEELQWQQWVLFMLKGVEVTANYTIQLVKGISSLMARYKIVLKSLFDKQYKHELLNNLFYHPYTKIEFLEKDLGITRQTASRYLQMIVDKGLLQKVKIVNTNYYINTSLVELFVTQVSVGDAVPVIESVS